MSTKIDYVRYCGADHDEKAKDEDTCVTLRGVSYELHVAYRRGDEDQWKATHRADQGYEVIQVSTCY